MNGGLCLICGDDEYLVESSARTRISQILPDSADALGLEIVDGRKNTGEEVENSVNQCIEAVQTQGFFGAEKVVWLRDANFLTGGERVADYAASKDAVAKLTECLKNGLPEGQTLIITAGKVLRSSVFFKTCLKNGEVEDFGNNLKARELEQRAAEFVAERAKESGLKMDSGIRNAFIQRVGFDTRTLVQEIEKLRLYVGEAKQVHLEDLHEITSVGNEAEAWDLIDAVGERNAGGVLATLRRMSGQKGVGIRLAAMLDKSVRELLVLREAYDRKWISYTNRQASWVAHDLTQEESAILSALPFNPRTLPGWMLRKKMAHAVNYTLRELRVARFRILELREKLVSTGLPEMFLLEMALMRIVGQKGKTASVRAAAKAGAS
jgi:DNA polymerase-3 subunit delta